MNKTLLIFPRKDGEKKDEISEIIEKVRFVADNLNWNISVFPDITKKISLVLSVGGDGTFLEASHIALKENVPVAGINAGSLGFLAEIKTDELDDISEILKGNYEIQKRIVLSVTLKQKNEIKKFKAVNEAVAIRNQQAPMLSFFVKYDSKDMSVYKADGIVVATPTGSTAYNLSLNGPILFPVAHSFVINAMAPHSLTHRPIVLPSDKKLEIFFEAKSEGMLTIDGKISEKISCDDAVFIEESENYLNFIPSSRRNFFDILSRKLHLGRRD